MPEIQILQRDDINYKEFRENILLPNQPWIGNLSECQKWALEWTVCDSNGNMQPNWKYLVQIYGSEVVTVHDCESGEVAEKALRDAIPDFIESNDKRQLYIKDWHLALHCAQQGKPGFYETPSLFKDDFMNNFYIATQRPEEDFRFVYAGLKDTITFLHRDVYSSYSWSYNVVGRKRWYLFHPTATPFLRNRSSEIIKDVREVDANLFPDFARASEHMLVVEQEAGQTIFVSVDSHLLCLCLFWKGCNAHNIQTMYRAMTESQIDVEYALRDVKELMQQNQPKDWQSGWNEVCQNVLRQDAGWEWALLQRS